MDLSVVPWKCQSFECPVALVLHDKSRHLVCKHMLINASQYFEAMFQTDMKEKQTNQVNLQADISQSDLLAFLEAIEHPVEPLPNALQSLIFLADRFMCPSLGERIQAKLINGSLFNASAEMKLELLETADKHRGNSTDILDACVRLCGNLEPDQASSLHGKITDGTLAAVLLLVAKITSGRTPMHSIPFHWCSEEDTCEVWRRYDRVSEFSRWVCDTCHNTGKVVKNLRFGYEPITFEKIQKIPINKDMYG